jgi:hypothetical protein
MSNKGQQLMAFTFFSEKEGSTFIEQFSGKDLVEALADWYGRSIVEPCEQLEGDDPTSVDTVKNVWCISGHDTGGKFFLTHIVATAP